MTPNSLDPMAALVAIFTAILGPTLAPFAGAYFVIFLGAAAGLMVGLRRREPTNRLGAAGYAFVTVAAAVMMTVSLAEQIGAYMPKGGGTWLFFPVSLSITAFGETWLMGLRKAMLTLIDMMARGSKDGAH